MEKVRYTLADGIEFDRHLIGAKYQMLEEFGKDEGALDAFDRLEQCNNDWILKGYVTKSEIISALENFKTYLMTKIESEEDATELSNLFDKEIEKIFS